MPRSYWLPVLAVVGLALSVSRGIANEQQHKTQPDTKASQQQTSAVPTPASVKQQKPARSETNTGADQRAEQHDKENLAVQRSMAESAGKQTDYAWDQVLATYIEAFLLAVTIFFTGWAAMAASAGTRKAGEAIAQSERHAREQNRPYLFVYGARGIIPSKFPDMDGHAVYTVANRGKTPAVITKACVSFGFGNFPEQPEEVFPDHSLVVNPVVASDEVREGIWANSFGWVDSKVPYLRPESEPLLVTNVPAVPKGKNLYLWVKVFYEGPFTKGGETSACWEYDITTGDFVSFGGPATNYNK